MKDSEDLNSRRDMALRNFQSLTRQWISFLDVQLRKEGIGARELRQLQVMRKATELLAHRYIRNVSDIKRVEVQTEMLTDGTMLLVVAMNIGARDDKLKIIALIKKFTQDSTASARKVALEGRKEISMLKEEVTVKAAREYIKNCKAPPRTVNALVDQIRVDVEKELKRQFPTLINTDEKYKRLPSTASLRAYLKKASILLS